MVTQFHTLLHFVTLFPVILSPTTCVAASTRNAGVSKSHLLSINAYVTSHCSGAYEDLCSAGDSLCNQP